MLTLVEYKWTLPQTFQAWRNLQFSTAMSESMRVVLRRGEDPSSLSVATVARCLTDDLTGIEHVWVLWSGDGKFHPCDVIEYKNPGDEFVYVHFLEFDRRMDIYVRVCEVITPDGLDQLKPDQFITLEEGMKTSKDISHHDTPQQEADEKKHQAATKFKNLDTVRIGKYEMETWYYSPFPPEFSSYRTLHFCDLCFDYFGTDEELSRHSIRCTMRYPPGCEIYRSEEQNVTVSMFEVDGLKEQKYCENLCLIAKLFLDHKTVHFDTKIFLFYVLCEVDDRGCHMVGYFSKEKPPHNHCNNLACILTLPCHQRKGYGNFLISISYELSIIEKKPGTPETPLSDLGRVSYESYWGRKLVQLLVDFQSKNPDKKLSMNDITHSTGIRLLDVRYMLEKLSILRYGKGDYHYEITDAHVNKYYKKVILPKFIFLTI